MKKYNSTDSFYLTSLLPLSNTERGLGGEVLPTVNFYFLKYFLNFSAAYLKFHAINFTNKIKIESGSCIY